MTPFFDTNIFVYAFEDGEKRLRAQTILAAGGVINVQVLNEFVNVSRNKVKRTWPEVAKSLDVIGLQFPDVRPLTAEITSAGVALARDHGLHIYDALIVAAALEAGCDTLFSEDLQDGRKFGGLTIRNPFIEVA